MIIAALLNIVASFILVLVTQLPMATMSDNLRLGFQEVVNAVAGYSYIIPVAAIFQSIFLLLTLQVAILSFQLVLFVIRMIRGSQ